MSRRNDNNYGNRPRLYEVPPLEKEWITLGIKLETVKWAEDFAEYLVADVAWNEYKAPLYEQGRNGKSYKKKTKPLSTTQLRRFFGEMRRIQHLTLKEDISSVIMLKPKLAYAVGREDGKGKIKDFYEQLSIGLDAIDINNIETRDNHFNNFVKIVEAIVAYHKAKGGK